MEKKNVVLVVEEPGGCMSQEMKKIAGAWETETAPYAQAIEVVDRLSPETVILDMDHQKDRVCEILQTSRGRHPHTNWVIAGAEFSSEDLMGFVRLGAADFIHQPVKTAELKNVLLRFQNKGKDTGTDTGRKSHQVISFFSCKGGVGVSLLAANAAISMAKHKDRRVLAADFVLQHGNMAEMLDIDSHYTVSEFIENLERVDDKLLENSLFKHRSGTYVLPCPRQLEDSESFTEKQTGEMVDILRQSFDVIFADLGHEFNPITISCLDRSDRIFLVTTPDLASLCSARIALRTFKKLGYAENKVKLVLNRWQMKGGVDLAVIEKNLQYPVYHKIPEDVSLALSAVNQGMALGDLSKKAAIVKAIDQMAERFEAERKGDGHGAP